MEQSHIGCPCWTLRIWHNEDTGVLMWGVRFWAIGEGRKEQKKKNNTRDSNVVPHRSTNRARRCLTSLSRREAVLSSWYGRSYRHGVHSNTQLLSYLLSTFANISKYICIYVSIINHRCLPTPFYHTSHSFYTGKQNEQGTFTCTRCERSGPCRAAT